MNTIEGDLHDPLTATYRTLELARLNDALKQCGVADTDLRRKICETYFFDSGYFLDSWPSLSSVWIGRLRPGSERRIRFGVGGPHCRHRFLTYDNAA